MRRPLSRRTLLRGSGVALALPWLEAMTPRMRAWATPELPRRLAFVYVPNGAHMPDWKPQQEGRLLQLPWILEPLDDHRDSLLVLSGLTQDKARANGDGPGDHARAAAAFLTGVQPYKSASELRLGISADQVAAQRIGHHTAFASLELGCDGSSQSGQCDSGYACAYSSHLAWTGASTPLAKETEPRAVFDRLFLGGASPEERAQRARLVPSQRSILDRARAEAKRLAGRLGARDRAKLDEYLTAVRQLEGRLQRFSGEAQPLVDEDERPAEQAEGFRERAEALFDVLALAFQTDSTRVATFMMANEGSNRSYPEVDVSGGHHEISHHGDKPEKQEQIRRINRHHMTIFAGFLDRLRSIPEGDGSLLDQCMIVYGSGIADGNRHAHHDLPLLVAGSGGGSLWPGRHLKFESETPATNLFLSLLDRMGAGVPALGDSTGRLEGLG